MAHGSECRTLDHDPGSAWRSPRNTLFTVQEARKALHPTGGARATRALLHHYVRTNRLPSVTHGVYAVVPAGVAPDRLRVDLFLAAALRPDGVFSYHSALELLGASHSVWRRCTLFTSRRRPSLDVSGVEVVFADFPAPFRVGQSQRLGTQRVERLGTMLVTTGPERTLVDGLRSPWSRDEELVAAVRSIVSPLLDLSPSECEFVAAVAEGDAPAQALFPDDARASRLLSQHPALAWKLENVRRHLGRRP